MQGSRRNWIIAVLFLVVALGLLLKLRGSDGLNLRFNLKPEQTFFYNLSYFVQGESTVNPLTAQPLAVPSKNSIQIEASLALRLEQKNSLHELEFSFRFVPSMWQIQLPMLQFAPEKPQDIEGRIVITEQGQIIRFALRQEQMDEFSPWMADIFSLMSITLPSREESWVATEEGFQSRANVSWRLGERDAQRVRLNRSYVESQDQSPNFSGMGWVSLDLDQYLHAIELNRQRHYNQGSQKLAYDTTTFKMERTTELQMPGTLEPKALVEDNLRGNRFERQQERAAAQRILGMSSASDVKMELNAIDQAQMKNSIPAYQKLKALFLLYPEQIVQFREFVLQYPYSDLRCAHVLTALTAVSSTEAQAFLRSLFHDLHDQPGLQRQIIPHLTMVNAPDEASESFIRELTQHQLSEIRSTAQLGLGTIAHQLREDDPTRSMKILQEQKARLTSQDSREKLNALRSIGNIGMSQQLEIMEPYLNDRDVEIRRVAVDALRHVESAEARGTLLKILAEDADSTIRLTAAESLKHTRGSEEDLQQLKALLYSEKEIPVLKQIISHVSLMATEFRTGRDILQDFAEKCGHPELCNFVESTLQSISKAR